MCVMLMWQCTSAKLTVSGPSGTVVWVVTLQFVRQVLRFWSNHLTSLLYSECEGNRLFQITGTYLPNYAVAPRS